MSYPAKCRRTRGIWKLCRPLAEAVDEANQHRRGLCELQTVDWVAAPTRFTRTFAIVHRRHAKHCGVVLNLCPWCGADIAPNRKAKGGAA